MKKILFSFLFFFVFYAAFAHNPIITDRSPSSLENAINIKDPSISQVYYSQIDPDHPYTWFKFYASANSLVTLSVGVPYIDRLRNLSPIAILIGPGLPEHILPFSIPEGYGAVFLTRNSTPTLFHEEITDTKSWIYYDQKFNIKNDGEYYFVAYPSNPIIDNNKLWMVIGTKEQFSLLDIFSFGKIRKYVRTFHELK